MITKKQYIICAAVKYKDTVVLGHNHGDIIQNIRRTEKENPILITQEMQGFVDNHGKFLDRQEAAMLAYFTGQIKEYKVGDSLRSEEVENRLWLLKEIK